MARGQSRGGALATATLASVLAAVVVAGGGCEIAIGSDVPDFECVSGAAVCPGNEVCDLSTHQCVAPCSPATCSPPLQCDPSSNLCVVAEGGPEGDTSVPDVTPDADASLVPDEAAPPADTGTAETGPCRGLTCACSGDAACDSGICADSSVVPSGLYTAAGSQSFCTKPCCTSADCDANSVCFAAGGADSAAGNYCVSPTWVQRSIAFGAAPGGSTCATGRDCRSGLCAGTTCADTCCTTNGTREPNQCATGSDCRFAAFPGTAAFDKNFVAWCGPGGSGGDGADCSHNSDCKSELCDGIDGCANACRDTADCSAGESCTYVNPPAPDDAAVVAACFGGAGGSPEGSSCSNNTDCESQFCDTTVTNECTDVCFADTDCTKTGWRCRPESVTLQSGGKFSVLACGP